MKKKANDILDAELIDDEEDNDIPDDIIANIEKKETQKDAFEIMKMYNDGRILLDAVEPVIKMLFTLNKKDKITTAMLFGKEPEGIDKTDYKELVSTYIKGIEIINQAKEEMINKLDMFIYYVIERKFSTFKKYTKDLYQEGVVGILKGIDTYDPSKSKPTTFFYIYILHEMTEFINLNINKTTSHYSANIVKVKKAINRFEREGRKPTIKDIAQETGISAETIAQALNIMESSNEVHYDTVDYLDSKMSQNYLSPEDEYLKNEADDLIQSAINILPIDEGNVIRLKYGLSGEEPMSYKNISLRLDIQIDKVKKLNSAALRKLRRSRIISGNFKNLQKEEKALNDHLIGVVPIVIAETIMDELDHAFSLDEKVENL